jgi:hypothetical protein
MKCCTARSTKQHLLPRGPQARNVCTYSWLLPYPSTRGAHPHPHSLTSACTILLDPVTCPYRKMMPWEKFWSWSCYRSFTMWSSDWKEEPNKAKLQLPIRLYVTCQQPKLKRWSNIWSVNQWGNGYMAHVVSEELVRNSFQFPPWSDVDRGHTDSGPKQWGIVYVPQNNQFGFLFVNCIQIWTVDVIIR